MSGVRRARRGHIFRRDARLLERPLGRGMAIDSRALRDRQPGARGPRRVTIHRPGSGRGLRSRRPRYVGTLQPSPVMRRLPFAEPITVRHHGEGQRPRPRARRSRSPAPCPPRSGRNASLLHTRGAASLGAPPALKRLVVPRRARVARSLLARSTAQAGMRERLHHQTPGMIGCRKWHAHPHGTASARRRRSARAHRAPSEHSSPAAGAAGSARSLRDARKRQGPRRRAFERSERLTAAGGALRGADGTAEAVEFSNGRERVLQDDHAPGRRMSQEP